MVTECRHHEDGGIIGVFMNLGFVTFSYTKEVTMKIHFL